MALPPPQTQPKHNVSEVGDLLNGMEGRELQAYAFQYVSLREQFLKECNSEVHIYTKIKELNEEKPFFGKRREKKKTRIQMIFDDSSYGHRPDRSIDDPIVAREIKQAWNMNPGRLYIPKHVAERMRETDWTKKLAAMEEEKRNGAGIAG